jgi:hypothetical protein
MIRHSGQIRCLAGVLFASLSSYDKGKLLHVNNAAQTGAFLESGDLLQARVLAGGKLRLHADREDAVGERRAKKSGMHPPLSFECR